MINFYKKFKNYIFIIGGAILGFIASSGLLFYSGKELVNIFVYLIFIVFIPFILSIFSFISYLLSKDSMKLKALKSSMLGGVFFSFGALLSLLLTVTTKDIAFGWATTLNIKSQALKEILDFIAIWKSFCQSCTPDTHLIELSRYSRLGQAVSKEQIQNAITLGQWWKFLAASILFYGVIFRGLIYLIAIALKRDSKIEFKSNVPNESFKESQVNFSNVASIKNIKEFKLIGYHFDTSKLNLKSTPEAKTVVVAVKSWEPPIMDFFDFLDEIESKDIYIYLVGLDGKKADKKDINIWLKKLNELNLDYKVLV